MSFKREPLSLILAQLQQAKDQDLIKTYSFSFFCDSSLYSLDPSSIMTPSAAQPAKRALYIYLYECRQSPLTVQKLVEHFQNKYHLSAEEISPFVIMVTL